ncbi:unnamed protein product [Phytophthora fragariaefolia]|uniref:Unnamed protein product n=1 Tax=Phytophthora fragariaefolia TaxID=1490495 RepID=A0A9W7DAI1_9STRA|nr:unnamed protein product [Phytophthora fragariaefolia]
MEPRLTDLQTRAQQEWPHVAVVDLGSMTHATPEESDGPSCAVCEHATCAGPEQESQDASEVVEHGFPRPNEQWFSEDDDDVVEHGFPRPDEQWLSPDEDDDVVERGLPLAVEHGFPRVVNQELPEDVDTAGQLAPRLGADVESRHPESGDEIEHGFSPSVSEVISVLVWENADESPRVCNFEVTRPPRDTAEITRLPGLSWKHFLRDLNRGEIEQVCMIVAEDAASIAAIETYASDSPSDARTRPKGAEPKNARIGRYASQSLRSLEAASNPLAPLIREFSDIFPDKVPAILPLDRGVRHEIDLVPGAKRAVDCRQHAQWNALGMARDATGAQEFPCHLQSHGVESAPAIPRLCTQLLRRHLHSQSCRERHDGCRDAPSTPAPGVRSDEGEQAVRQRIFCAPEIPVLGSYVSTEGVRADLEKIEAICAWPVPQDQKQLRQWLGLATYLHHYSKNFAAMIRPLSQLLKADAAWSWRPERQTAFDAVKTSLSTAPILMLPDHSKAFHVVCDASDIAIGCALMQFDDEGRERVVSYQSRQLKPPERTYPVHDKELLAMRYALIKFRVYLLGEQTFADYTEHASLRTATKSPHLSQRMARWLSLFSEYNFVVHYKPGKTNILADALSHRPDYVQSGRHAVGDEDDDECAVCIAEGVAALEVAATTPLQDLISAAYESDAVYTEMIKYLRDPSGTARRRLSARNRARIDRYQLEGSLLTYSIDHADPPRIVVQRDDDLRARLIHEFHDAPSGGHLGREKTFASLSRDFY